MYTAEFSYHKASSVSEALGLLAANPDAKLLAGGHSLIPAMKLRLASPSALIDVSKIADLHGIRLEGDTIIIGAMTTHRDIEFSSVLKQHCGILPEQAAMIGDPMVRNKGTIGGALAHADPAADYPAAMLALNAQLKIQSASGSRVVSADEFFQGMFTTAVGANEMLVEIHLPANTKGSSYAKFSHPASRYALAGVAVVVHADGTVRAAYTGAGDCAARLTKLEAEGLNSSCQSLVSASDLMGDHFASAEYRAHLINVMAKEALGNARGDELERIEGIGPKMANALRAAGIRSFGALAKSSEASLQAAIRAAEMPAAPSLGTWAQQADLLARGDEAGFKVLTDRLTAGRE
jgi:aerobic carbon-monoxide dehydrogenase medium subunit